MKKVFRPLLSLILCAVLVMSIFPVINASDEFDVIVNSSAVTDGAQLVCEAELENITSADGEVAVVSAVYNKKGEQVKIKKEMVSVAGNETVSKDIIVDYSSVEGEVAKIFFWKGDTAEPFCEAVCSSDVPFGAIVESEEIDITSSMVFASSEPQGNHRVTAAADDDLSTYWTARAVSRENHQSVTVALDYEHKVTRVGIAFGKGSERQYVFKVYTSRDGINYYEALGETTSELTDDVQYFDLLASLAKFVRISVVERVESDDPNNWIQISEVEVYGTIMPVDLGIEADFYGFNDDAGTLLPGESDGVTADGWLMRRMTEETYTNYTPSVGEKLYVKVDNLPEAAGVNDTALHLYDAVERNTDEVNGAGGVMAAKQYPTNANREKYSLKFNMFIPSVMEDGTETDTFMSGFTITDKMVSGGADLSGYAAIAVRFEEADGKVRLKRLNSNQFNEGSRFDFMSTTFEKDRMWTVTIDVDPTARRTDITVTDGINTETEILYFTYNNAENTRASYWGGLEAKWLIFNTGAGAKGEYFVDNVTVTHYEKEEKEDNELPLASYSMGEEDNGNMSAIALVDSVAGDFEASLGENLYAELTEAPYNSGINGDALHLYDQVGRVTDAVNGAGGVMAYVDIPTPEARTAYKVEFTIFAPQADDYAGFSLGSGRENVNCYGIQLRYINNAHGVQLNRYTGNGFNKGDFKALLGSYEDSALKFGNFWKVQLIVNPATYSAEMIINDGNQTQSRTFDISTSVENWNEKKLDTLSFNTGIGGFADMYVGDIKVTDLGEIREIKDAAHGIVRLQAVHGTGNFMHHQGNETSDFAEKQDPNYTRFVERSGLMDSNGVSFEVMNRPGYFLTIVPGDGEDNNQLQVQPYSDTARFKANATFYKVAGNTDPNSYGRSTYAYASYRDPARYLYNDSGNTVVWKRHSKERTVFYLRSEAQENRISDNFKGTKLDKSKWIAQYPWGDFHNHYGLCRESAIELKNGIITLKANKIGSNDWPTSSKKGEKGVRKDGTGIDLSSYGFGGDKKWQAYVGVISSGYDWNKVYWSQSYMEGSFKQPNCGYGYWTAFWLAGVNGWPPETDIFEYLSSSGSAGAHGWYTNMHYSSSVSDGSWYWGSNLRTQYHRYALDWGPDYMDMYYDGQLFRRYTGYIPAFQDDKGGATLIINTGVGGWESSLPSEYGIGLSLEWFRSYQY